jgi:hypothetical protein
MFEPRNVVLNLPLPGRRGLVVQRLPRRARMAKPRGCGLDGGRAPSRARDERRPASAGAVSALGGCSRTATRLPRSN